MTEMVLPHLNHTAPDHHQAFVMTPIMLAADPEFTNVPYGNPLYQDLINAFRELLPTDKAVATATNLWRLAAAPECEHPDCHTVSNLFEVYAYGMRCLDHLFIELDVVTGRPLDYDRLYR